MLDENINYLIDRCKGSVTISINPHKDYNETIQELYDELIEDGQITPDILQEAIKRNNLVHVFAVADGVIAETYEVSYFSTYHYDIATAVAIVAGMIKECDDD